MALDPESQRLLDLMAAANQPAWITLTPAQAREQYLATRAGAQGPRPEGVSVIDRTIPGAGGAIPVRLYRPEAAPSEAKLPALVFAHGGGWVFGNLDSHDVLCAQLAIEAGIVVFAIDYRLAPEARFPGAFALVSWPTSSPSLAVQRTATCTESVSLNLLFLPVWAPATTASKGNPWSLASLSKSLASCTLMVRL